MSSVEISGDSLDKLYLKLVKTERIQLLISERTSDFLNMN